MSVVSDLFSKKHLSQFILAFIFIVYLFMGYTLPFEVSRFLSSMTGNIVVGAATLFLIATCNPIVGVLAVFVAFELTKRAKIGYSTVSDVGLQSLAQFNPKERLRPSQLSPTNQFPLTLEEEMVTKLAPICDPDSKIIRASYVPNSENYQRGSVIL